jgi:hypothetical protein
MHFRLQSTTIQVMDATIMAVLQYLDFTIYYYKFALRVNFKKKSDKNKYEIQKKLK